MHSGDTDVGAMGAPADIVATWARLGVAPAAYASWCWESFDCHDPSPETAAIDAVMRAFVLWDGTSDAYIDVCFESPVHRAVLREHIAVFAHGSFEDTVRALLRQWLNQHLGDVFPSFSGGVATNGKWVARSTERNVVRVWNERAIPHGAPNWDKRRDVFMKAIDRLTLLNGAHPEWLYHGTPCAFADRIEYHGIDVSYNIDAPNDFGPGFYLNPSCSDAWTWCIGQRGTGTVLVFERTECAAPASIIMLNGRNWLHAICIGRHRNVTVRRTFDADDAEMPWYKALELHGAQFNCCIAIEKTDVDHGDTSAFERTGYSQVCVKSATHAMHHFKLVAAFSVASDHVEFDAADFPALARGGAGGGGGEGGGGRA